MIYTSDGEAYEDSTAHAFDVKSDLSQSDIKSMTHTAEPPADEVQKTVKATGEHFRNSLMQGPELMRDFMEGKTSSEDPEVAGRALGAAMQTTPYGHRGLDALKAEANSDTEEAYDFWAKRNPEAGPNVAFMRGGKVPKVGDLEDVEPSENIMLGKAPQDESIAESFKREIGRIKVELQSDTSLQKDTLGIGLADLESRITEGKVRSLNKKLDKQSKIIKPTGM